MALSDTANLIVALRLDDKFSGPLKNAQGSLTKLERSGMQVGKGIRQVSTGFTQLGTRAAVVAAGGLTAVVKTAIDFESAFAGVAKTVEATPKQLEELNAGFRELARTIPLSFEEFAAIGEQAGALGIARQDILEFTKVVAQIGTTTDVSSDAAATALGQLSNILQLTSDDFDNFGAALVDLGNKGASTESAILEITRRFGATGAQAGLAAEEVLAFASAAANLGLQPELAGGALTRFFLKLGGYARKGGDELKLLGETTGQTAAQFKKAFEKDASGAVLDLIQSLEKLPPKVRAGVLADLGFSKQTGLNQLLSGLTANSDNLAESLDTAADGWRENTALTKEAEKRYATTASKLTILKNNVRDAANTIGSQLLPVIADLSTELVEFINQPDTQRKIKEFADNLAKGARELVAAFKRGEFDGIIENLKGAAGIAKTAFDAFNALPGPVKQFAIAAIVANKATGGALGLLTAGAANIFKGILGIGGGLLSRGSFANPMFTKEVGLAAGGGLGPTGGGGLLGRLLPIAGAAFAAVGVAQLLKEIALAQDPNIITGKQAFDANRTGLFGLFQKPLPVKVVGSTPLGQFTPANQGGTPAPFALPKGVLKTVDAQLRSVQTMQTRAIRAGNDKQARILQTTLDQLHGLRSDGKTQTSRFVAGIGKVNAALSVSNRNLREGTQKQRQIARGIEQARDRIGTGFRESNDKLGVISRKQTSFTAHVTTNVNAQLSVYSALSQVTRVTTIRSGFTPTGNFDV